MNYTCAVCRDEGTPARVLAVDAAADMARVVLDGAEREVALDLLDGVQPGDFILVHLDVAIAWLHPADVIEA